jgi:hypothetical protein
MTIRSGVLAFSLAIAVPAIAQTPPSTAIEPSISAPRPGQAPELSPEQKSMIFRTVRQDRTRVAKQPFPAEVGAEVPPSLELYHLPDDTVIEAPVTKVYRVVVTDGKVVLVDPTTMRVVDVIDR